VLQEALSFRNLAVTRDEYAISAAGMKMFGVMDLNHGFDGGQFSIGLRNSNDKSMRLALTAGYRVLVCDNMAFSGDFTPLLHKHTRNLESQDSVSIAVDRIYRGFGKLDVQVKVMRESLLTDDEARLIIYRAFVDRELKALPGMLLAAVHENYFAPAFADFSARTLWSLSNAFTSAFKKLTPTKQFEATARLGKFLSSDFHTTGEGSGKLLQFVQHGEAEIDVAEVPLFEPDSQLIEPENYQRPDYGDDFVTEPAYQNSEPVNETEADSFDGELVKEIAA
jgi:hypothetical protein